MSSTFDPLFDSATTSAGPIGFAIQVEAAMRMHNVQYERANRLEVEREQARDIACSLEGELADLTARVAEAVRWLELAASYSPTEDCDAAIGDALAALRGDPS